MKDSNRFTFDCLDDVAVMPCAPLDSPIFRCVCWCMSLSLVLWGASCVQMPFFFFFLLLFSSWYVRQIALNFGIVCQCRWRHVFSGSEYNSMICCCCQRKMCALSLSLALSPCSIRSAAWLLMERTRILLPAYTSYLFRSETLSHFLFQNYCHVNKYNERGKH